MIKQRDIWQSYSIFQSAANTQSYLKQCYEQLEYSNASTLSYDNCYAFIYYLEHASTYYNQADKAPLSIKPVLIFYGFTQLLKACLLTIDPDYPSNSSVLAHGVSTRKRKRKNYDFLQDEVKIQKDGLLPYFSEKMFHVKQLDGEKYSMSSLLKLIPEINDLFLYSFGKPTHYHIGSTIDEKLRIPLSIIDDYKMTQDRFVHFMEELVSEKLSFIKYNQRDQLFEIELTKTVHCLDPFPFSIHYEQSSIHIPTDRSMLSPLHEVIVHYLLLYNLSMISRYETEWWGELLHTFQSKDFPFIQQFLSVTIKKVPYLLFHFLYQKRGLA